jgi:C1A family cysteine protease
MRFLIAALLVVCVVARVSPMKEAEYQVGFLKYVNEFNKKYDTAEVFHKYNTYKYWVDYVANHNAKNLSWTAGINEFSDMMPEEFAEIYLTGLNVPGMPDVEATPVDTSAFPNDVDWRTAGAVTGVKNQGSCGSCWAFSTTGAIEGYNFVTTKKLPNLSEQQLVDCSKNGQTIMGCQGGWPWAAAQWVQGNGGLCAQGDYPYTGRDGTCKKTCTAGSNIKQVIQQKGEDQLLAGVNFSPISICLDAAGGFQSYRSGIFDGPCGTQMNHAVLAVGYTADAWIVKNSWGTTWGDKGYIQMRRGKNLCGMSNVLMWAN